MMSFGALVGKVAPSQCKDEKVARLAKTNSSCFHFFAVNYFYYRVDQCKLILHFLNFFSGLPGHSEKVNNP